METTGGVDTAPIGDKSLETLVECFTRNKLPFERLSREQLMQKFPHFRVGEGEEAVYQKVCLSVCVCVWKGRGCDTICDTISRPMYTQPDTTLP